MTQLDTKTKLLDHANLLIKSVGVNAMSYADLSSKVGISKASIHHHFPKKEDLIIALIQRTNMIYAEIFAEIVQGPGFGIEKLYKLAEIYQPGTCKGGRCLLGMLSAEIASLGETVQSHVRAGVQVPLDAFALAFAQAQSEGAVASHASAAVLAHSFYALILGAQHLSHAGGDNAFSQTIELFLESL